MESLDRNIKRTSKVYRGKEIPVVFYKFKKDSVLEEYAKISRKFFKKSPRIFLILGPRDILNTYEVLRRRLKKLCAVGWGEFRRDAKLASWFLNQCKINSLVTYPKILLRLGPAELKFIQIIEAQGGPRFDSKEKELLRRCYPRAKFMRVYGVAELDKIGFQCEYIGRTLSDRYHFSSGVKPELNSSGELLITQLKRFTEPLVRYKTGDRARIYNQKCPCGRRGIVEVLR